MLKNLTIRIKLLLILAVLIVACIAVGLVGYNGMTTTRNAQDKMATVFLPSLRTASSIQFLHADIEANEYALLVSMHELADRKEHVQNIETQFENLQKEVETMNGLHKEEEDQVLWDAYLEKYNLWVKSSEEYRNHASEIINLLENGAKPGDPAVVKMEKEQYELFHSRLSIDLANSKASITKIIEMQTKDANTEDIAADIVAERTTMILIITIIIGIVTAITAGLWITSNIGNIIKSIISQTKDLVSETLKGNLDARADTENTNFEFREITVGINETLDALVKPLKVSADHIQRISKGDMPQLITDQYYGDFNDIKESINLLISSLNEITDKARLIALGDLTIDLKKRSDNDELMLALSDMVKSVAKVVSDFQTAAENISGSSQQMSSTAQEMSQGATEQASSAEEVSSSMEQMAANITQNTENAQQTQKIALNAADGIAKVAEAAKETLKNIEEIADKVSIIGEIARQTNILALNAAVEAARAGEHGKGFAVVAAEVRKLAERSQVSAVEIDTLTKSSVRATEDAGKLMEAIVPEISKTARLVQEIAAASVEQNSGAEQVNSAIQQLNQVTQQNAAASEEVATSSEELSSQAEQLLETVRFFKLEKGSIQARVIAPKKTHDSHGNVTHFSHSAKTANNPVSPKKTGFALKMDKVDVLDSEYEKF